MSTFTKQKLRWEAELGQTSDYDVPPNPPRTAHDVCVLSRLFIYSVSSLRKLTSIRVLPVTLTLVATCVYFMTYFLGPVSTILSGVLQRPIISLQPSVTGRSGRCSLNRGGRISLAIGHEINTLQHGCLYSSFTLV